MEPFHVAPFILDTVMLGYMLGYMRKHLTISFGNEGSYIHEFPKLNDMFRWTGQELMDASHPQKNKVACKVLLVPDEQELPAHDDDCSSPC